MSFNGAPGASSEGGFFKKIGAKFGFKAEKPFQVGDRCTLINANTREVQPAVIESIDPKTGQIKASFDGHPVPRWFANMAALREGIEEAKRMPERTASFLSQKVIEAPKPHPVAVTPRYGHEVYTAHINVGKAEYEGRARITSTSASVQGGVYLPDILEYTMEGIVVDYEKDLILREYLEKTMLPYVLLQRITHGRDNFEAIIKSISIKIQSDFPYQKKMLDKRYAQAAYPAGQKVALGKIMRQQDMVCRHMGLLFAVSVDFLKKKTDAFATSEVRFMADMQRDFEENERNGHAYCIMRNAGKYYAVDPTAGMAKEAREILTSKQGGDERYRYLFSILRFLGQEATPEGDQLIMDIMKKTKADPKLAGLIGDLKIASVKNLAFQRRLSHLESRV